MRGTEDDGRGDVPVEPEDDLLASSDALSLPVLFEEARWDFEIARRLKAAQISDDDALARLERDRDKIYGAAPDERQTFLQRREQVRSAEAAVADAEQALSMAAFLYVVPPRLIAGMSARTVARLHALLFFAVYAPVAGMLIAILTDMSPLVGVAIGAVGAAGMTVSLRARQSSLALAKGHLEQRRGEQRRSEHALATTLVQAGVREVLRVLVAEREAEAFDTTLSVIDQQGLAEVEDPSLTIPTDGQQRLGRLLDDMPGGSIAISGARGAGKTTLMRMFCSTAGRVSKKEITVMIPAPVKYGAREFVLHLFAELCKLTIGPERVASLRNPDPAREVRHNRGLLRFALPATLLATGAGAVMVVDAVAPSTIIGDPSEYGLPALLLVGGLGAMWYWLTRTPNGSVESWPIGAERSAFTPDGLSDVPAWRSLQARAEDHLQDIWFQQSYSSGWSGALNPPIGIEVGVEGSRELARHQMSLPDIVRNLRSFVDDVPAEMRVIVAIDELDKMASSEVARSFLNEIKVVFGIHRCYYLLSISEDALNSFERRGLPLRDVLDSSFDESVYVRMLDVRESTALLQARVLGMPVPFMMLCHCMSGGLPRDTIRVAREMVALNAEQPDRWSLSDVAHAVVRSDLEAKTRGALVAAGRLPRCAATQEVFRWLRETEPRKATADLLLERCADGRGALAASLAADDGDVSRLACELLAFTLFCGTVLELFSKARTRDQFRREHDLRLRIDRLAKAQQAFAIDPAVAWQAIRDFRLWAGLQELHLPDMIVPVGATSKRS